MTNDMHQKDYQRERRIVKELQQQRIKLDSILNKAILEFKE